MKDQSVKRNAQEGNVLIVDVHALQSAIICSGSNEIDKATQDVLQKLADTIGAGGIMPNSKNNTLRFENVNVLRDDGRSAPLQVECGIKCSPRSACCYISLFRELAGLATKRTWLVAELPDGNKRYVWLYKKTKAHVVLAE